MGLIPTNPRKPTLPAGFVTLGALFLAMALAASPARAQDDDSSEAPSQDPTRAEAAAEPPRPAVLVETVSLRDVTPEFRYVGRVEAVEEVGLRARVTGFLEERPVAEGREVRKGELLFQIEKAPYEAVVGEREAAIASAKATLNLAQVEYNRAEQLVQRAVKSQDALDLAEAERKTAEAQVMAAEAALRGAALDLRYTEIRSPIDGRIGLFAYDVGDLVGPDSGPLATVTSTDPVHVVLQVREEQLLRERKRGIDLDDPRVSPTLELADGEIFEGSGRFDFLAPTVNRSTDTVTARAVFDNPDGVLLPGQFVNVIVRVSDTVMAVTVPQKAVQRDAEGYFALVVDREDQVNLRRVAVSGQSGDQWVISDGLLEGERIVVEGIQKVSAGAKVDPVTADPAPLAGN